MTPAARLSAAITVLDRILAGAPVEQSLTNWGRGNRFAGSGDRHAIRDLVFDALRCRQSFAALGGGLTGRGLVLGGVRSAGGDVAALFSGEGHAPAAVRLEEAGHLPDGAEALDVPDWLTEPLQVALGAEFPAVMQVMRHRAPVFLRVNLARISRDEAERLLADAGIATEPVDWVNSALEVIANERKIRNSAPYLDGLVELQDASSQAVVALLDLRPGMRVLDYCAGGGGKTLAMAALGAKVDAHDANAARMSGLAERAGRAGAKIRIVQDPVQSAPYEVILVDAPCSGSGSWRRDPQGKWALTPERLAEFVRIQAAILDQCVVLLQPKGMLAYVTCSLLAQENEAQVAGFLARHPGFHVLDQRRFSPLQGGDGFFGAMLTREVTRTTQL